MNENNIYGFPDSLATLVTDAENPYGKRADNVSFAKKLRERFKAASIEIINFFERQKNSPAGGVVRFQLLKSATSAAANYRAVCRARSQNEFYAKHCTVVEETDKTLFWLELLRDSTIKTDEEALAIIGKEWQELLMIVAKAKSNTRPK